MGGRSPFPVPFPPQLVLAFAFALAACGGGGGSSSATPAQSTPPPPAGAAERVDVGDVRPGGMPGGRDPRFDPYRHPRLQLLFTNTGSGSVELATLQIEGVPPNTRAPLLVAFHQFSTSHLDIFVNTTFPEEAAARGWYLLAPLSGGQAHFSSLGSQINTQYVIDWVRAHFLVDEERIYGVGFSLGGGAVTNYAARHLDPSGAMFAALANHTGTVSLAHSYDRQPDGRAAFEAVFGGSPAQVPFAYQRSSVIDLDPVTGIVHPGVDLARNLTHIPTYGFYVSQDPLVHLREQNEALAQHMQGFGAPYSLTVVDRNTHTWLNLDETDVCDFLAPKTLTLPTAASTLADHDDRYFWFDVVQDGPGAFTPFDWSVDAGANRLELAASENLAELGVHTLEAGLDPAATLEVSIANADGSGDVVVLGDYPQPPAQVLRDGLPGASWSWDVGASALRLEETDGAGHLWTVLP